MSAKYKNHGARMINIEELRKEVHIKNYKPYQPMLILTNDFEVSLADFVLKKNDHVPPSSMLLIGKGGEYDVRISKKQGKTAPIVLYIDSEIMKTVIRVLNITVNFRGSGVTRDNILSSELSDSAVKIIKEMYCSGVLNKVENRSASVMAWAYIMSLFEKNEQVIEIITRGRVEDVANRIVNVIEKDLNKKWKAEDVSRALFMTESCLRKKLQKENLTFKRIVKDIKMKHAAILIKSKNLNVSNIAHELGFSSTSYFIKTFKEYYDVTPKQYTMLRN